MKHLAIIMAAGTLLAAGTPSFAQKAPVSLSAEQLRQTCDRACLIEVMDQYLAAMVANDPRLARFGTHIKFTENGVVLPLGSASWRTMEELGKFRQYVADPTAQSVGFHGTFKERGQSSILSVRLKLVDRLIVEAEQIVVRRNEAGAAAWDERMEPGKRAFTNATWNDTLKPSERVSRDHMIAIVNSYFSSIQGGAATPVPFAPDCYRIENGYMTAGAPETGADATIMPGAPAAHSREHCTEQLGVKGFFVFNNQLRDRRFLVIDEEKGIVFSHVFFDHAGIDRFRTGPNGEKQQISPRVGLPNSLHIHEMFWIKNGKIQHINANLNSGFYGMSSGWEDRDQ